MRMGTEEKSSRKRSTFNLRLSTKGGSTQFAKGLQAMDVLLNRVSTYDVREELGDDAVELFKAAETAVHALHRLVALNKQGR